MANEKVGATVKISRYNPDNGKGSYSEVFDNVPFENMTVLDVLKWIYEYEDTSLVFRESCRNGSCAVCTLRVNGKSVLACKKLAEPSMTIEPPRQGKLIKDLVAEMIMGKK